MRYFIKTVYNYKTPLYLSPKNGINLAFTIDISIKSGTTLDATSLLIWYHVPYWQQQNKLRENSKNKVAVYVTFISIVF